MRKTFVLPIIGTVKKSLPVPSFTQISTAKPTPGRRQRFSKDEDKRIRQLVEELGINQWALVAKRLGNRSARQCRERWHNYLSEKAKNGPWTADEEQILEEKVDKYGQRWTLIATFFKDRSEANVKNHWTVMKNQRRRKMEFLEATMQKEEKENFGVTNSSGSDLDNLSPNPLSWDSMDFAFYDDL